MHEASLAQILIEQIHTELTRRGITGRVHSVEVSVGALAGVVPEALSFAFEALTAATSLAGAQLVIREVPAICSCRSCGEKTTLSDLAWVCPHCGSEDIRLEGGRDLRLEAIEIVDEEGPLAPKPPPE